ncbi:stage IV sporulation protein A [[Clostridium] hylemonae]|uniref:Stage IV sporulation protein A n=1 Tax=[Clostridium] hylemonae DSM 15053 TaxID=553973 RepID=C0C3E2_9FIRM|nr:stage IV sporulation protein A [[Clostridium] hylemonae]EEG73318.1 stage IV sporulation protein A [[Clostridium] hylemonae DSM 15053]QEK17398.1 Stage IV sporulation protein A [[Clostridium] hylemonae DSM 15053]BDF04405.1 stage IV sporulation protein A [[Clostridium] hylemonae]
MNTFQLYKDIQARTNGEIYIGVVGPVRTGKSTFIKRFMDVLVLPHMEDEHGKSRTKDELPQSASGRTIMTTEPKFVPKEAAEIRLSDDVSVKVRLIDCVGYMVEGASGHIEGGEERQVKTPWFDYEIPFTKAATIGTRKVIHDHATIGIVVTTDGSIGDIERQGYREAEDKTIRELQSIGKPFIVLVNSKKPYGDEARETAQELEQQYGVKAMPVNCEQLKEDDIYQIMEAVLFEFPVSEVQFFIPKWVEMLPRDHRIKQDMLEHIRAVMDGLGEIKDAAAGVEKPESPYINDMKVDHIEMDTGCVKVRIDIADKFYYEMLSELTGTPIAGQYELITAMKNLSELKDEYEGVKDAFAAVRMKGYGVVSPKKEEITLEEPVIIKQGNKFGVKIHSEAPSIHLIRANIETEIAPIVGSEQQAEDLVRYIKEAGDTEGGIWSTNIFGKSIEDLVMDGMQNKMAVINDESQVKLQDTMQKIVNDSNGGLVCIII